MRMSRSDLLLSGGIRQSVVKRRLTDGSRTG
jgi:hypothetical protein